jgi:hypothetical protein
MNIGTRSHLLCSSSGGHMRRQKDKDLQRKRNRKKKLHYLKILLQETTDSKTRKRLLEKINRISVYPYKEPVD